MSVLVYAETPGGKIKKQALEAVTYGARLAKQLGTDCVAVTIGQADNAGELGVYGAAKVINVQNNGQASAVISAVGNNVGATVYIFAHSSTGKSIAAALAVRVGAGIVSGATALPNTDGGFVVRKNVFSGKAAADYTFHTEKKVITVMGNSLQPEQTGSAVSVESMSVDAPANRIKVRSVKTAEGIVPLPEAELVVSAGRGMKGPENWGMIEELAGVLNATTACSRPVADVHWRPHHEHVGQTGIAIRPNLYIAIGISGAIQHLAGVNQSKCIVVINKDPEAPFFKAADYGVVGDLFEIVPRLIAAFKNFKANQ